MKNTKEAFEELIHPESYQVFLMDCPARLLFASHPWFVVNEKGVISRWAVSRTKHERSFSWGHLNKDLLSPFQGLPLALPFFTVTLKSTLLGFVEGDESSLAAKMAKKICSSPEDYMYCERYSLLGPNSNTYAEWIIDQFPEARFKLPWNAFGKTYLKKRSA